MLRCIVREALKGNITKSEKLCYINNAISLKLYSGYTYSDKLKQSHEIPSDYITFGTVGRLVRQKNHEKFIKVVKVKKAYNKLKFLIIGEDLRIRETVPLLGYCEPIQQISDIYLIHLFMKVIYFGY